MSDYVRYVHGHDGSLKLLEPLLWDEYASPEGVESLYDLLEQQHPSLSDEFQKFGSLAKPYWRNVCRIACTKGQGSDLTKERALLLTQMALGPFCPPQKTIEKDTFRAIGIALSLATGVLVSPKQAYRCFHRPVHQGFQLSKFGETLLMSHGVVSWPPPWTMPAFADELQLADVSSDRAESLDSSQKLSSTSGESGFPVFLPPSPAAERDFRENVLPDLTSYSLPMFFGQVDDETTSSPDWSPGQVPISLGQVISSNQLPQFL